LGEITRRNFLIEGLFLFCEMVQQNIAYWRGTVDLLNSARRSTLLDLPLQVRFPVLTIPGKVGCPSKTKKKQCWHLWSTRNKQHVFWTNKDLLSCLFFYWVVF
jgi:hypothetical protein